MEQKRISIKEFREKGYLQEVNRQFFHPLGLALEVTIDDDGTEYLSGVWDCRDDLTGIIFDFEHDYKENNEKAKKKADFVAKSLDNTREARTELLGSIIEQIPNSR